MRYFDKSFSSLGAIFLCFCILFILRKTIEKKRYYSYRYVLLPPFRVSAQQQKLQRTAVRRPAAYSFQFFCRYACAGFGYPASPGGNRRRRNMVCRSTLFFSPGFNVGLVGDLYICPYLNLRFTPTLLFGNKTVELQGGS